MQPSAGVFYGKSLFRFRFNGRSNPEAENIHLDSLLNFGNSFVLDHRFLFIISIDQVCVTDDDLIHFVFPLEDHRHLINLGDVLKDPLLQFRFRIDPNVP